MQDNHCHIPPTDKTPEVIFNADGTLSIKGRAMALNRTAPSEKLLDCIERYLKNPAGTTTVIIELECLNSFGTQILVAVIRKISQVTNHGKRLVIKWYYDEEDDDILDGVIIYLRLLTSRLNSSQPGTTLFSIDPGYHRPVVRYEHTLFNYPVCLMR